VEGPVSAGQRVGSDHQLARLLQIGVVLEEVVEARAYRNYQSLTDEERKLDPEIEALLEDAAEESADHRERLETLIEELDADSIPFEQIERLVEAKYGQTKPEDFDGVLYDQLCNEETAYKFYDDLIAAIEASDAEFSVDRERLVGVLEAIRAEEADGVEEVTEIMETRT
jgi:rubrerythrin